MPKKKFRLIKGYGLKKKHTQVVKQLGNQLLLKQVMAQYRECLRANTRVRNSLFSSDLPSDLIKEMGLCDGRIAKQLRQKPEKVDSSLLIKELKEVGIIRQRANQISETFEGFVVYAATDQVGNILQIYRVRKAA